jgi:hypothetical protein
VVGPPALGFGEVLIITPHDRNWLVTCHQGLGLGRALWNGLEKRKLVHNAQDRAQWRTVLDTVMNLRFP